MSEFKKVFDVLGFRLVWWLFAFYMGVIYGPFSYIVNSKFVVLNFTLAFFSVTVLVVVWSMAFPFLYLINQKIAKAK